MSGLALSSSSYLVVKGVLLCSVKGSMLQEKGQSYIIKIKSEMNIKGDSMLSTPDAGLTSIVFSTLDQKLLKCGKSGVIDGIDNWRRRTLCLLWHG